MPRRVSGSPRGDFASAAMVRVLVQGMADLGLPPPALPAAAGHAHVDLDTKRLVVRHAITHGGLDCLARLGRGIRRFAHEPVHQALVSGQGVDALLRRWSRLETYVHSRHRVALLDLRPGCAQLRHASLAAGARPLPAESLVVLGLLAALLGEIGLQDVSCTAGGVPVLPHAHTQALARAVQDGTTDRWQIRWRAPRAGVAPLERAGAAAVPDLVASEPWPAIGKSVFRTLAAALPAAPDLAALARQHAVSPRHLQRQLQQGGLRYADLLAEARYRVAGWWLLRTDVPLAEVGFLSGHADQPHLTRVFRQRSGMTPDAFRKAFALGA